MASFLLFLFVSTLSTAAAQQRQTNIRPGFSLKPNSINSSLLSPSRLYAFGFYRQGDGYRVGIFLAGIPPKTVVWTANRDKQPVSDNITLVFTTDSGLILQSAQGQNIQDVIPFPQAASASLFDSANFILYNSDGAKIWQSFEQPTDTLLPTQSLQAGKELVSSISENDNSPGIFRLKMQHDENLVQYPVGTLDAPHFAYYASETNGEDNNVTLNLDRDGYLYLRNSSGIIIKNITVGRYPIEDTIYMMRLDFDGIFRLYSYNLTRKGNWSVLMTSTDDKCAPNGICGLNSYCVLSDIEASCVCLPGFSPISLQNLRNGCKRDSITTENCKNDDDKGSIRIQPLPNTNWEDDPYSKVQISLKEDCEQACLKDCNCDAAFFKDGWCNLQKLPLKFGRRDPDDSNLALIKVGRSISIEEEGIVPIQKKKRQIGKGILIASSSVVALGFLILTILGVFIYRYHIWAYERISDYERRAISGEVAPRSFSYAELETVTNGFKEDIGRGSFGTVYKGLIRSSQKAVAVKKLEKVLAEGEREFQMEMKVIGKTHHKNLVRLLGYCNEGPHRLLVYEFMSNGSLAHLLFSPERRPCFTERMEIARNVAKGILYLHEECETQIIHCDIKAENILMDEFRCPKISDFGLAKLLKQDQTKTFTGIRGTRGYVAPEWHRNLPVTVKADVYSYGVVLLEIACCRKNVKYSGPEDEGILTEWVYDCFMAGEMDKLIGDEEVDKKQLDRMIKVGLWCTLDEPSLRPSMKKILLMLEGTVDIPVPPSPTSFLSSI